MKKLLTGLVPALALVLFLNTSGCSSLPASTAESAAITDAEWDFICSTLKDEGYDKVDCSSIRRPTVVLTAAVHDMAEEDWILYGFTYPGEDYVFVGSEFSPETQRLIVVHETTHYVLDQAYGAKIGDCESEHVARIVHHKWKQTAYDPSWMRGYGCVAS